MWTFATLITRLCGLLIVAMWAITRLVKRDAIGSVVGRISWVMPTLVIVALLIPNIWMLFALLLCSCLSWRKTKLMPQHYT